VYSGKLIEILSLNGSIKIGSNGEVVFGLGTSIQPHQPDTEQTKATRKPGLYNPSAAADGVLTGTMPAVNRKADRPFTSSVRILHGADLTADMLVLSLSPLVTPLQPEFRVESQRPCFMFLPLLQAGGLHCSPPRLWL
jgi:hypothetical protein